MDNTHFTDLAFFSQRKHNFSVWWACNEHGNGWKYHVKQRNFEKKSKRIWNEISAWNITDFADNYILKTKIAETGTFKMDKTEFATFFKNGCKQKVE